LGKQELRAQQASERGGFLLVRTEANRVVLSGQVVNVWRGALL